MLCGGEERVQPASSKQDRELAGHASTGRGNSRSIEKQSVIIQPVQTSPAGRIKRGAILDQFFLHIGFCTAAGKCMIAGRAFDRGVQPQVGSQMRLVRSGDSQWKCHAATWTHHESNRYLEHRLLQRDVPRANLNRFAAAGLRLCPTAHVMFGDQQMTEFIFNHASRVMSVCLRCGISRPHFRYGRTRAFRHR